uniref:Uncharacterized protein n=1 Tax=Picea glauca TaxID=3330 RepID=A0A101LYS5_PICGL|nr:hypothetical protein ABT39_MTgene4858 [Picea glauca]
MDLQSLMKPHLEWDLFGAKLDLLWLTPATSDFGSSRLPVILSVVPPRLFRLAPGSPCLLHLTSWSLSFLGYLPNGQFLPWSSFQVGLDSRRIHPSAINHHLIPMRH